MPSATLRKMQDEAAELDKTIATLRAMEPKDDEDRKSIEERLDAAMKRADEVAAIAEREQDLDRRQAKLQAMLGSGTPKKTDSEGDAGNGSEPSKRKIASLGDNGLLGKRFDRKVAGELAAALRDLSKGRFEMRDGLGGSSDYTSAGAELIMNELYPEVLNVVNYSAALPMLGFPIEVVGNKVDLPTFGEIDVDFIDEGEETTAQTPETGSNELFIYDLRAEVPVNNNVFEDSPVMVPELIRTIGGSGFSKKLDAVWLGGHTAKSITGLADAIDEDHTVDLDGDPISATVIGSLYGKIEDVINGSAWVASQYGWGELCKIYGQQAQTIQVGSTGRILRTINGEPVVIVKGMDPEVLAIYGDFRAASAFGYKPTGFRIEALREVGYKKNRTIFNMIQRVGVKNHAPQFVAKLIDSTLAGS